MIKILLADGTDDRMQSELHTALQLIIRHLKTRVLQSGIAIQWNRKELSIEQLKDIIAEKVTIQKLAEKALK